MAYISGGLTTGTMFDSGAPDIAVRVPITQKKIQSRTGDWAESYWFVNVRASLNGSDYGDMNHMLTTWPVGTQLGLMDRYSFKPSGGATKIRPSVEFGFAVDPVYVGLGGYYGYGEGSALGLGVGSMIGLAGGAGVFLDAGFLVNDQWGLRFGIEPNGRTVIQEASRYWDEHPDDVGGGMLRALNLGVRAEGSF